MMRVLFFFPILLAHFAAFSQIDSISTESSEADTSSKYVTFYTPEDYELDLAPKKEDAKLKRKKPKKKVFYGKKTKKGFTVTQKGKNQIIETFFYLKKWEEPSPYIKDIYWYDYLKLEINKSRKFDSLTSKLLHGPYEKSINGVVVESGIYYLGTKHGRWETWSKPKNKKYVTFKRDSTGKLIKDLEETIENQQQLLSKEKYDRGWPRSAEITYYDSQKRLLKEVKPYKEGDLHGEYYYFDRRGRIITFGKYEYGEKVGQWVEYQENSPRHYRKRITLYQDHAFFNDEPFIVREWDEKGKLKVDNTKKVTQVRKARKEKHKQEKEAQAKK